MTNTDKLNAGIIPVTPLQQNCALLWDGQSKEGVIVDPGGETENIAGAVKEVGMKPTAILLTHGHIDHAGGANELSQKLSLPIHGPHRDDKFLLDELEQQGPQYGFAAQNCVPDKWFDEGDTFQIGRFEFETLHCPGHSPGSLVYVNHANKFIIMGDVLFRGSIGRTDFPYGNHSALIDAIMTKLLPLGDAYAFICGHGPGSSLALERQTNPFLQVDAP
ncbi:MAG: MBL fold metallo-hydrolase [Pseudomonadota bacterium]